MRLKRILLEIKARTVDKFHLLTPLIQARARNQLWRNIFRNLNGLCPLREPEALRPAFARSGDNYFPVVKQFTSDFRRTVYQTALTR